MGMYNILYLNIEKVQKKVQKKMVLSVHMSTDAYSALCGHK